MGLNLADAAALAAQCAPGVAPETLLSIVSVESGFEPLAIGVNGTPRITVAASTAAQAQAQAETLIRQGRSVDLGLAQINSRNLAALGLDVAGAFDPCRNLAASAKLLTRDYGRSRPDEVGVQAALRTTLSYYNTGDPRRGLSNGYVAKVAAAAGRIVPAITVGRVDPIPASARPLLTPPPPPAPPPAPWDVFGQARSASFVIRVSTQPAGAAP